MITATKPLCPRANFRNHKPAQFNSATCRFCLLLAAVGFLNSSAYGQNQPAQGDEAALAISSTADQSTADPSAANQSAAGLSTVDQGVSVNESVLRRYGIVPLPARQERQPRRRRGQNVPPTCSSPHLTYNDGPLLSNVIVVPVFWGPYVDSVLVENMPQFYADAPVSSWWNVLYEYGAVNGASGTNQSIGWGTAPSEITITPSLCGGSTPCTVSDAQIQTELQNQIAAGNLPPLTPDANGYDSTLYMIHFPTNVTINLDNAGSCSSFGGYHNNGAYGSNNEPMPYAVLPTCPPPSGMTELEWTTYVASHELAEATTDTDPETSLGWYDISARCPDGGEIADLCVDFNTFDTIMIDGRNWAVTELWSNLQNQCTSTSGAHPTFQLSLPSTTTPGTPFNFTLTAENAPNVGNAGTDNAYIGTVSFSSSDSGASLPAPFTFGPSNQGTATFSATLETKGPQSITVNSTSGTAGLTSGSVTVLKKTATSIRVTSVGPASEAYSQDAPVTITAVLFWTGGGPAPTASAVTIGGTGPGTYGTTICGAPSGTSITCKNTYAPSLSDGPGSYTEAATFSGDNNYTGSSSTQSNNFSIAEATSTTSVTSSLNPSTYGQSVTFTATISGEYGQVKGRAGRANGSRRPHTVTGSVTWSANTGCGTTAITSGSPGTASCTTSTLPMGNNSVTATYSGDSGHSGSSGSVSETVEASTSISVTNVSPASEDYGLGAPVTITAFLSWSGTGSAPTAANVAIGGTGPSSYGTTSCGTPVGTQITCTNTYTPTPADGPGSYTETATFFGDANYTASSSAQQNNFTINQASSSMSVASGVNPSTYLQPVTFTATIGAENGNVRGGANKGRNPKIVSGSVTWSANTGCGTTPVTAGYPGVATCTTPVLSVGTDTVSASYSGDSNHSGSSASLSGGQVVNQASQYIGVSVALPRQAQDHSSFTVVATGGASGNPLVFSSAGECTNSPEGTYTIKSTSGTCTVNINQAGNNNYLAAPTWTYSLYIEPGFTPTVSLTGAPSAAPYGSSFAVTASSNENKAYESVPTITATSAACSVGALSNIYPGGYQATVTMIEGTGSCDLKAAWALNAIFNPAFVKVRVTAERITPSVSLTGAPAQATNGSSFTVTATSDESGSYASVPTITTPSTSCSVGAVTNSGPGSYQATVTMTANSGICTLKAAWAASTEYPAASSIEHTTAKP